MGEILPSERLLLRACAVGGRRSFMVQNSIYITIQINVRLQRDYRLVLGLKRSWIIATVIGVIQLVAWILKTHF